MLQILFSVSTHIITTQLRHFYLQLGLKSFTVYFKFTVLLKNNP